MKIYYSSFIVSIFLIFSACEKEGVIQDYNLNGAIFGTTYKIIYLNGTSNYQKSIDSLFLKMNTSLSTYIPNSAISKINNGAKTLVIEFEEFAVRPEPYIDKISSILHTSKRDRFDDIMKKLSLPRETVDILGHDAFLKKYKNNLSHKYLILLEKLENIYALLKSDINASQ